MPISAGKRQLTFLEQPGDRTSCVIIKGVLQSKNVCSPATFRKLHHMTENKLFSRIVAPQRS